MTRIRAALAATMTVGLTVGLCASLSLATTTAAHAAASDYRPWQDIEFTDPGKDATDVGDLAYSGVEVDPNLGQAFEEGVKVNGLRRTTPTRLLVESLGTTTSDGTCDILVELVSSTQSRAVIARAPGAATVPKPSTTSHYSSFPERTEIDSALLENLPTITCVTASLTDATGDDIDTAATSRIENHRTKQGPVAASFLGEDDSIHSADDQLPLNHHAVYRFYVEGIVYDETQQVQADPGVKASLTNEFPDQPVSQPWDQAQFLELDLKVTTPGDHTVTMTLDGGNADPTTFTFHLYAPGGPLPPATGDLTGRAFLFEGRPSLSDATFVPVFRMLYFQDSQYAWIGEAASDIPVCTAQNLGRATGCHRYAWDKAHDVLQVGQWRGSVNPGGTFSYRLQDYRQEVRLPAPGTTYDLHVGFTGNVTGHDHRSFTRDIDLHADGTFVRSQKRYDDKMRITQRGHYRILSRGRIVFISRKHTRTVQLISVRCNAAGQPDPEHAGLVIDNYTEFVK